MNHLSDVDLNRMITLDQGDSYILRLPDGTRRTTGYTAEGGGADQADVLASARRIYDQWVQEQEKAPTGFLITFDARCTLEGKPFIAILVNDEQIGQLDPGEVQHLGLRAIQSGIEAERDAGFFMFMRTLDPSREGLQAAGAMLHGIREHRQQVDPDGHDVAAEQS